MCCFLLSSRCISVSEERQTLLKKQSVSFPWKFKCVETCYRVSECSVFYKSKHKQTKTLRTPGWLVSRISTECKHTHIFFCFCPCSPHTEEEIQFIPPQSPLWTPDTVLCHCCRKSKTSEREKCPPPSSSSPLNGKRRRQLGKLR